MFIKFKNILRHESQYLYCFFIIIGSKLNYISIMTTKLIINLNLLLILFNILIKVFSLQVKQVPENHFSSQFERKFSKKNDSCCPTGVPPLMQEEVTLFFFQILLGPQILFLQWGKAKCPTKMEVINRKD